jgi:DNA-binding PadR family transcriptional regulator
MNECHGPAKRLVKVGVASITQEAADGTDFQRMCNTFSLTPAGDALAKEVLQRVLARRQHVKVVWTYTFSPRQSPHSGLVIAAASHLT